MGPNPRATGREAGAGTARQAVQERAEAPDESRLWWLAVELGVRSDPRALYEWLDRLGAKECGEGLAVFRLAASEVQAVAQVSELVPVGARAYLIGRHDDINRGMFGRFIHGGRQRPPWEGFASDENDIEDEEE